MNAPDINAPLFDRFSKAVPTSVRAQLAGLSDREIQAWALRQVKEYRRLAFVHLSLHNAAAHINRILPAEIIVKIFVYHFEFDLKPTTIAQTCCSWRTIALDAAPQLWAAFARSATGPFRDLDKWNELEDDKKSRRLATMVSVLKWSKRFPFRLSFISLPTPIGDALGPYAGHLAELRVQITSAGDVRSLSSLLKRGLSTLETLSVDMEERGSLLSWNGVLFEPSLRHALGKLPALRHLPHVPLDLFLYLSRPTLINVKIIEPILLIQAVVSQIANDRRLPSYYSRFSPGAKLVTALQKCEALQTLSFEFSIPLRRLFWDLINSTPAGAALWFTKRAVLPSLRKLKISVNGDLTYVSVLLKLLTLPPRASFSLVLTGVLPDDAFWEEIAADESASQLFSSVDSVRIATFPPSNGPNNTHPTLVVACEGPHGVSPFTLVCTTTFRPNASLRRLRGLFSILHAHAAGHPVALLCVLPHLTALALVACPHTAAAVAFHALGTLDADGRPCCPELCRLDVKIKVDVVAPNADADVPQRTEHAAASGQLLAEDEEGRHAPDGGATMPAPLHAALVDALARRAAATAGHRLHALSWSVLKCSSSEGVSPHTPEASVSDLSDLKALVDEFEFSGFEEQGALGSQFHYGQFTMIQHIFAIL
ncbi:uncharacterized protein BXZ73DRAFT_107647 [Epithele typhae]|uniref:uncharacterized protein n=1 Tax=Epithele typhae TaxID=378194 RepID=UPI002007D1E4|nr:uncharacterized protein BXZ73DRAFT_107647 [Epithele typhae]KAH9912101.1 hypothetical protein BXZ73DRAFT_107647 [Epithele typhae]